MAPGPAMSGAIVGRHDELAVVEGFLDGVGAKPGVLIIEGQAGIGKTTIWAAALEAGRRRRYRVLSCRTVPSEVRLGYVALADLLAEVEDRFFDGLPSTQRNALDAVLFRGPELSVPPDPRAVAVAFLSVLEAVACEGPAVVAVDDLQWLDDSSRQVLDYAVRRLSASIGVVVAVRTAEAAAAPLQPQDPERLFRLVIGPLSLAALHRLLSERMGRSFPRAMLVRIHQVSDGNPFYALELVRALGEATIVDPAAVPASLAAVVGARLEALDPDVQEAVLVVSALGEARTETAARALADAGATEVLSRAEADGVLVITRGRVRVSHPLLGAGAYGAASIMQRRTVHRRLAQVVDGIEERARHLALAAVGPDPDTLAALEEATEQARRRGAPAAAAELAELAIALGAEDPVLLVRAAEAHLVAGNPARATELVHKGIAALCPGRQRAAALGLLARIRFSAYDFGEAVGPLLQALEDAGDEFALRAELGLHMAYVSTNMALDDPSGAAARPDPLPYADDAVMAAEQSGNAGLLAEALAVRVIVRFLMGQGLDEASLQRAVAMEDGDRPTIVQYQPTLIAGMCLMWTGKLGEAQALLSAAVSRCLERGDDSGAIFLAPWLTLVECWRGEIGAAHAVAADALERAAMLGGPVPKGLALGSQCIVCAFAGQADDARRCGREALGLFEEANVLAFGIAPLAALCLNEVSVGDFEALLNGVGPVAMVVDSRTFVGEPLMSPFVPDVAEALIAVGRIDEAEPLVDQLEERGRTLDRPWALAVGGRCRGLLLAARGDLEASVRALEEALVHHEHLAMPLDRARSLLVLGQIQRRANQRRSARATLEEALCLFESAGARLWVDKARAELRRLGGRRAAPDTLTATEEQIAHLAGTGLTNRAIAAQLFISPKTVEANLARIYRKLGIRTRSEMHVR